MCFSPQSTMGSLSTAIAGFGEYPVRFQNDKAVGFTVVYLDRTRAMNPIVSRIVVFKQGGESVEVKPESSEHRDFVRELQRWDEELVRMRPIPPVYFQCTHAISALTKPVYDAIAFVPPTIIERPWPFSTPQDRPNWWVVDEN